MNARMHRQLSRWGRMRLVVWAGDVATNHLITRLCSQPKQPRCVALVPDAALLATSGPDLLPGGASSAVWLIMAVECDECGDGCKSMVKPATR
jgi:hypothetical protein